MAEVYRAIGSGAGGFEKQLAIKRILPSYAANNEFRRMFEYEAHLCSQLTHSNIVQVYDFVKANDTYFLIMEYVNGKDLKQLICKAMEMEVLLPIPFSVYVISEVCMGLAYAHDKKDDIQNTPLDIIHRDMSPQNIMISYDGGIKIVDFGIAKALDRMDATTTGIIKGKYGYMAPEQVVGKPADRRSDIFCAAVVLFEILSGRRLFYADNPVATLALINDCVIPSLSQLDPKITPELEAIVLKGLRKEPTDRYPDAGEFHQYLQEFLSLNYPSYTQRDVSQLMQQVFVQEIDEEKKRFEQAFQQCVPLLQEYHAQLAEGVELDPNSIPESYIAQTGQHANVMFPGGEGKSVPPKLGQTRSHNKMQENVPADSADENEIPSTDVPAERSNPFARVESSEDSASTRVSVPWDLNRLVGVSASIATAVSVVLLLSYRLLTFGKVPDLSDFLQLRGPASQGISAPATQAETYQPIPKTSHECALAITAEPDETVIFVNGIAFGQGYADISAYCSSTLNIKLIFPNSRTISETITLSKRQEARHWAMSKFTSGKRIYEPASEEDAEEETPDNVD